MRRLIRIVERALGRPSCRICGCTEHAACRGGCWWVEPDLCSDCARPVDFDYEDDLDVGCSVCGGEGIFWGSELPGYDPGWHDPDTLYPCPACQGSGDRKDQVLF